MTLRMLVDLALPALFLADSDAVLKLSVGAGPVLTTGDERAADVDEVGVGHVGYPSRNVRKEQ